MGKIHNVPILVMNWIADQNYELIRSGKEDLELKLLMKDLFDVNFDFKKSTIVKSVYDKMKQEEKARIEMHSSYQEPPNTVKILETKQLMTELKEKFSDFKIPDRFFKKKKPSFMYWE